MALSKTIPIKGRIFTAESLDALLTELSRHYNEGGEYVHNFYLLQIAEDEYTTTLLDEPPISFASVLTTPIHYLSLRFDCSNPSRHVELMLFQQADFKQNNVRLHSNDEDWVTVTYARISKLIENVEQQSTVFERFGLLLGSLFALIIGWPLKNLFLFWGLHVGFAKMAPSWTWDVLFKHTVLAVLFGALPAAILTGYVASAFPQLEIKTGPPQRWKASRRRSRLKFILAVIVLAPLGNLLYDAYKSAFS